MADYLDFFADWYPEFLGNHFYPVRAAKTFTLKERELLQQTLTTEQKSLLERHRKYRIRSLFLKNSYLQTTQWRFLELKINPFYPEALPDGTKLNCECGRPLKFQFILHSTTQKKTMALGINHFADHLNLPIEVAREIQKGINEIDIALDELLWLKKQQLPFPEQVWQRYCYAVFRNNQLKKPVQLNHKLPQRVLDFRQAAMPIYISDHEALENEIRRINQQAKSDPAHFLAKKTLFEAFYEDFLTDLATSNLYTTKPFLARNSGLLLHKKSRLTKIPATYYPQLLHQLQQNDFQTNKLLTEEVFALVVRLYQKYGFEQAFFLGIPRVIRNGLLKAIRLEKTEQEQRLAAKLVTLPDIFFQMLALLLKSPETLQQPEILQHYVTSMFDTALDAEELLRAAEKYQAGQAIAEAFAAVDPRLQQRLLPALT